MSELTGFLSRHAPFDGLAPAVLERVAAAAEERRYAPGETILQESGPPARQVWVVRSGAVELLQGEDLIGTLGPGEAFGHWSLLSGMAPAFSVRARGETTCLVLAQEVALDVFAQPAGVRFVAGTLRERLVRAADAAEARADVRTAHLGSLLHRPAAIVAPDATVREAAGRMRELDVSCVLVRLDGGFGIVTDSDLRSRLVAEGLPYETPVAELMHAPAMTFPADRLAIDAMVDMLEAGIHHLPVVDARGAPLGVVTATDLMYLESRTPFALRRSISHAATTDEVVAAAGHFPQTIITLINAGVDAVDLGRVLARWSDAATSRLIELEMARLGDPPAAWSWLALGSTARREQSLASDQDNALAYADDGSDDDGYFEALAEAVNTGLARCGFGDDTAGVLARNRAWRMSVSEWMTVFHEVLDHPDRSRLVRAAVAFDFRHVVGGLDAVRPLVEIERQAHEHPDFVRRLARTATDFEPPLGFRGRISLRRDGDQAGTFDIKKGGIVPIANLARFHALSAGVTISGTLDRLEAAAAAGSLPADRAAALREAFGLMFRIRLEHQAGLVGEGRPPDNDVDPDALPPLTRWQLQEALRAVAAAQKALGRFVPLGI